MPRARRSPAAAVPRLVALAAVVAVSVGAAGCTSSTWDTSGIDDTTPTTVKRYPDTEAGYEASLVDRLTTIGSDLGEWVPPRSDAECAASRIVGRLTLDRLKELGYDRQAPSLALGWSDEERTSVVNILTSCIDFAEGILETTSSYQKLGLAQSNCLAEGYRRLGLTRQLAGALVDGTEPDPFAESDKMASGMAQLAVECLRDDDLLPNAPMPRLPEPDGDGPSVSTTTTLVPDDGALDGVEPGSPLDTTTTIP